MLRGASCVRYSPLSRTTSEHGGPPQQPRPTLLLVQVVVLVLKDDVMSVVIDTSNLKPLVQVWFQPPDTPG